ncbi:hypothetical protein CWS72_24100 [Telmatospirillum siberiense]|uniref:histidine kinase n=1 Tax=Telmatospirillum siberiense TaxID=382514 RepID=A0A2N3PNM7_9PROT|nr:hypothetical protein CWS72_24100 [Telmatospirillum siberiense]
MCLTSVPVDYPCGELEKIFRKMATAPGVTVVDGRQLVGMISREYFVMTILRPYGRQLHLSRSVGHLLGQIRWPPLVIDERVDIETAVGMALSRRRECGYDPVVVTFADGQFGVLNMQVLLSALAVLFEARNEELQQAQARLIQTEKMASLGGLVAGIAHEISTPLGVLLGTAGHFADLVREIDAKMTGQVLRRPDFEHFLKDAGQASRLIEMNASRAADLVQSFKQVSVDQASGERRQFDLRRTIYETMVAMSPKWKRRPVKISAQCRASISCDTYPGALSQILTNLLSNSLMHGFDGNRPGAIQIVAEYGEDDSVLVTYSDDGKGIPQSLQTRVFDPFFTTRRNRGGTGLGLHVVYNLVTKVLRGSLNMSSTENKGVQFQIMFPRRLPGAATRAIAPGASRG